RVLGEVGDAHAQHVALARHPLVLSGISQVFRNHVGSFCPSRRSPAQVVRVQETGRAYFGVAAWWSAATRTVSDSWTITLPPRWWTVSTTPPGMFSAVCMVCGSPITSSVYGPLSRT